MACKLCLQKVYCRGRSLCVVTVGVPEEAQTTQRFGITKSVGCTFVLGLSLVRGHKEGAHLWGVREEKHHLLRVMASVSADREARERQGHLTGPQKGLHPSCSSQGTHFPHTIQAASFRGERPSLCLFLTGEQRPG